MTVDNGYDLMYRHQGLVYNQGDKSGMVGIQFTSGDEDEKGCFATYDGKTGSFIWKIDLKERYGGTNVSTENIISCDIDNDKKMEFIFGTNTGYLVALKGDRYEIAEKERVLWDVSIGASVSTIAIGDVYNTGKSAVVFAANDGYIHIVTDTGGTQTQEQTPDLHNKKSDSLFILVGILLGTLIISYTLVIVIKQKKV